MHWCAFTADVLCVWFACVDLDSACCRPWGSLSSSSCTWIVPARSFRLSTCSQREAGAPMRCAWRHGIACVRRPSLPHARLAVFFAWMNGGQTQVTDDAAEFISKATVTGPTRVPTSVTPGGQPCFALEWRLTCHGVARRVHPNAVGGAPYPGQKKGATAGSPAQPGADGTTQGADGEEAAKPEAAPSWTRYVSHLAPSCVLVAVRASPACGLWSCV